MANRWGESENSGRVYFLGSKITVDDDCSHEIKRCLLLEKKAMTNLDSILKSTDITFGSVQSSCSVMSDYLRPHGLQHARPPCPSLTPGAYSHSCPLNWWCHPTISSSVIPFLPSIFSSIRVFSKESALRIRWPNYWSFSFSISPSNEYSGMISFRIDWFDLLAVQGTLKSILQHNSSISSSLLSLLYGPAVSSLHEYLKNHSFHYTDLCGQSDISAF